MKKKKRKLNHIIHEGWVAVWGEGVGVCEEVRTFLSHQNIYP